jgi:hypothetical protein
MLTYKGYDFDIIGNDGAKTWRVYATPQGTLTHTLNGQTIYSWSIEAYNAAREWIDRQLAASEPRTLHNELADKADNREAPISADEKEFNRIASAARGTVRFERSEDYVIIAHCTTVVENTICGYLPLTSWVSAIYRNDDKIARAEFNSGLTYQTLNSWISASIVADIKKRSN